MFDFERMLEDCNREIIALVEDEKFYGVMDGLSIADGIMPDSVLRVCIIQADDLGVACLQVQRGSDNKIIDVTCPDRWEEYWKFKKTMTDITIESAIEYASESTVLFWLADKKIPVSVRGIDLFYKFNNLNCEFFDMDFVKSINDITDG